MSLSLYDQAQIDLMREMVTYCEQSSEKLISIYHQTRLDPELTHLGKTSLCAHLESLVSHVRETRHKVLNLLETVSAHKADKPDQKYGGESRSPTGLFGYTCHMLCDVRLGSVVAPGCEH